MFGFPALARGISNSLFRNSQALTKSSSYKFSSVSISAVTFWQHKQIANLISRCLPINPTTVSIMNLRQMLLKAKQQSKLQELAISQGIITLISNDGIICSGSPSHHNNKTQTLITKAIYHVWRYYSYIQQHHLFFNNFLKKYFRWGCLGIERNNQQYYMQKYDGFIKTNQKK